MGSAPHSINGYLIRLVNNLRPGESMYLDMSAKDIKAYQSVYFQFPVKTSQCIVIENKTEESTPKKLTKITRE